eukprot:CAMPEP_0194068398 /NCGR_PEP_ID=MMETSP0009_2-20130614/87076_1 /TAXON_ID=210454 /ORGANISM="Grammatophora oceanica, Strain CCMP 410" /LENGTH=61 /DNA_ID=CAMNT_0038721499 /DNA_START=459 /DNA_END=647 /DNA_ORIENTATION=-
MAIRSTDFVIAMIANRECDHTTSQMWHQKENEDTKEEQAKIQIPFQYHVSSSSTTPEIVLS